MEITRIPSRGIAERERESLQGEAGRANRRTVGPWLALRTKSLGISESRPAKGAACRPMTMMLNAAIRAGTPTTANTKGRLQPSASIQPPAIEPSTEPIRPMPEAQLTPVAWDAVG